MGDDNHRERKAGDDMEVQRRVRERPIERDEPNRPRETESGGGNGQGRREKPDPDPGSPHPATTERTARDRVFPDKRQDEGNPRDPMRDVESSGRGVR